MNNLMTIRPGQSAKGMIREGRALAPAGKERTIHRAVVKGGAKGQIGDGPHGGLGFRKKFPVRSTPFSVNRLITLSANRREAGRSGRNPGRISGGLPNSRYLRLARRHAAHGVVAGMLAVLLAAWSFTAALSEAPGWSITAACGCVLAVFISTLESTESMRCLRIAARWVRWDRELNGKEDP